MSSLRSAPAWMMALLLAACGGASPESDRVVLGFSQIESQSEWRTANTESIRSAAKLLDIELRMSDKPRNQDDQIQALRGFIAQKVDVITFSPIIETGWDAVLREAKAANIPVILVDRAARADPSLYAGFVGSDMVEQGRRAARLVVERFKDATGPVNIVELQGTVGSAPANDRRRGFAEVIAADPKLRIVRSQSADFSRDRGQQVMAQFLATDRNIQVLYAHNDDMALGAIRAIEEAGLKPARDIYIVSIDAVRGAFNAMIAGKLNASVECNPLLGPPLMTAVMEVVAGRPIPQRTLVDEQVFTMETAKQHIQFRRY